MRQSWPDRQNSPDRQSSPDTRREARSDEPSLPDDVTGRELERFVRRDLTTLSKENAEQVARHLVMAGRLLDSDPAQALRHAMAAQRRAGRVGVVREAAGLAAYRAGEYEQALRELRTARRLSGSEEHLPVMADCERGLGRPEKALELAASPGARSLDRDGQLELLIVVAGARMDMGQPDAAVVALQVPELSRRPRLADAGQVARLMSAYSDALEATGRAAEAEQWLRSAAAADSTGATGAADRLIGDETYIVDLEQDGDEQDGDEHDGDEHDGDEHDGDDTGAATPDAQAPPEHEAR